MEMSFSSGPKRPLDCKLNRWHGADSPRKKPRRLALDPALGYPCQPMKLYRAFATVGGLTMVSRGFGFARDMMIAAVLGTGAVADAFFVAFRFPNLFRRLFGEGAFNSAFVPLFAKRLAGEGTQAAPSFAEEALAGLLFVLLLLTALAEIGMPWLMY